MAREILFKAKEKYDRVWIEGFLSMLDGEYFICGRDDVGLFIDESTICQYTGLTDKNGNKIWENDVVKVESDVIGSPFGCGMFGKIEYSDCAFWVVPKILIETTYLFADECAEIEVIGNIFDNPELLGGGE